MTLWTRRLNTSRPVAFARRNPDRRSRSHIRSAIILLKRGLLLEEVWLFWCSSSLEQADQGVAQIELDQCLLRLSWQVSGADEMPAEARDCATLPGEAGCDGR